MQLFNPKTIKRHTASAGPPDPAKLEILRQWAATIHDRSIETQSETAIEDQFKQRIICDVLGYLPFNEGGEWTVASKVGIGAGAVDLALGQFTTSERRIIAPFELKGAKTKNLDAIMPGRAKTPVQQAWEYAADNVGTKWVLVSNFLEIRLYAYSEGRLTYEGFDLAKLIDPAQYQRLILLLSAENLLSGNTLALLDESRRENKDITDRLYADYRKLRGELIGAVRAEMPEGDPLEAIRLGQTILDRVLFTAFAEDNGLLPDNTLLSAFETKNPYSPLPVWDNFKGLFNAIDKGSEELKIPRYNGGLFEPNAAIDALTIPDAICEGFKRLADYDFASEISVTVLGHIFEHSIADVEQLQAEALGEATVEKKASGTSGRRKRDGVVYTPDYIARFIVDQTLGTHCQEIFASILAEHAAKGATADDEPIKWRSGKAEKQAWAAYRDRLTGLRIVDPACGSGVFLIMAFDFLKAELTKVNAKLAELEGMGMAGSLLDPDSEILTNNLFGVDVNSESVEIAKLSLWIKTARRGKVLDSLDANIRVGDSLIEDSSFAYRSHGFEWKTAFPDIFANGGFDVVLGNPPYVRMELIKPMKPWLQKRYEVVADRADLYAYFFERGIKLLKPGGRLGYISSSTFFKTGSGAPLRDFLRQQATIEAVIDFGDHQIFEGVTTYPAILTMRAGAPPSGHEMQFWAIDAMPADSFVDAFDDAAMPFPQAELGRGSWELEGEALRALRAKVIAGQSTLKDVYGSPFMGIKSGLTEAFVIGQKEKDKLCSLDPSAAELLKPYVRGDDLDRWHCSNPELWLVYIPRNSVIIEKFHSIKQWLEGFKDRLQKRATKQEWFELQQSQDAFRKSFESPKIIYPDLSQGPKFHIDRNGFFSPNTTYVIPSSDTFLLGLLNSRTTWFFLRGISGAMRGGEWRLRLFSQYIEAIPIPTASDAEKAELGKLAEAAQATAEQRNGLQQSITRRIPDLAADPPSAKLSTALKEWWTLPDFAAFQREVRKTLKAEIPLKQRSEWEDWITTTRAEINALTAEIARLEVEINAKVYALFDLTPAEIKLLEATF